MATKGQDITAKFRLDVSDLKKGIQEANESIKLANAQFKNASAGLDDWSKSQEGLEAKIKQLQSVLASQEKKLESYSQQLDTAKQAYEKASNGVLELKTALDKAKTAYGENSDEVKKLEKELTEMEKAETSLRTTVNRLEVQFENQSASVKSAKADLTKYENELGELTKESKTSANAVEALGKAGEKAGDAIAKGAEGIDAFTVATGNIIAEGAMSALETFTDGIKGAIDQIIELDELNRKLMSSTGFKMTDDYVLQTEELKQAYRDLAKTGIMPLEEAEESLAKVLQQAGDITNEDRKYLVEFLKVNEQLFDGDFDETLRGTTELMEQYGLSAKEAGDLIVRGGQLGLDKTHELGDNLTEYTRYFKMLGYSAEEMFGVLETGMANGAYNLDKANDLMKEFYLRITDVSKQTNIKTMFGEGLPIQEICEETGELVDTGEIATGVWTDFFNAFNDGSLTGKDAFKQVVQMIEGIEDPLVKAQVQSEIFGTQGEDNAWKVVTAMSEASTAMEGYADASTFAINEMEGSVSAQLQSFKTEFALNVLEPIGKSLLPLLTDSLLPFLEERLVPIIANDLVPLIQNGITWLDQNFPTVEEWLMKIYDKVKEFIIYLWDHKDEIKQWLIECREVLKELKVIIDKVYKLLSGEMFPVLKKINDKVNEITGSSLLDWLKKLIDFTSPVKQLLDLLSGVNSEASSAGDNVSRSVGNMPTHPIGQNAKGGIATKPTLGIFGEAGDEALLPLENNLGWIRQLALNLKKQLIDVNGITTSGGNNYFYQTINNPKDMSRIELYRQTKNLLELKGGK